MGYQMLYSCRQGMISNRVIQNVSRCQGRQRIARRVFSQTAKVGDDIKEDEENGFKISRIGSRRNTLVRSASANFPSVFGETIVSNQVIKSFLQPHDGSQRKTSRKDLFLSYKRTSRKDLFLSYKRTKKVKNDYSNMPTSETVIELKPSSRSPRQFSIISPDPKRTTKEQVLQLISKRTRMTQARYLTSFSETSFEEAIVILVTPAFAKWLEDDENFIKRILDCFTYRHIDKKPNYVVVVGAVVDGLAPSPEQIPTAECTGPLEGFSFLHGLRNQILSPADVWKPESFKDDKMNPDKLSHLIISGKNRPKPGEESLATTISLPLANTLFVNGKHSTLEISQWTRRYEGEYKCIQRAEKQYQHINAFHHQSTLIPPIFVPAVPLTLPRPIANGLGNIIRQLSFGPEDTDNRPASSELETQVTRYMEFSSQHTNIGVWALIYRKELLDPNLKATTIENIEDLESTWDDHDKNLRFVGTQIALGAILCRVVSGGGGWGAKQGLLSLDPQLTYEDITSARFDFTPKSIKEEQDSTLGNLARRGDHIQFFTINPNKLKEPELPTRDRPGVLYRASHTRYDSTVDKLITQEPAKTELNLQEATDLSWSKGTTFGVVPSTIDKLPLDDIADASTASGEYTPFLHFQKGEFGAVSESGIYLHSSHKKGIDAKTHQLINTKIDMPYSYLYRDQPGTMPTKTPEYKVRMNSLAAKYLKRRSSSDKKKNWELVHAASRFMATTGRVPNTVELDEMLVQCGINSREESKKPFKGVEKLFKGVEIDAPIGNKSSSKSELDILVKASKRGMKELNRLLDDANKMFSDTNVDGDTIGEEHPPIRKLRVGNTRFPKYLAEPERKREDVGLWSVQKGIRRVQSGARELKISLLDVGVGEGEEPSS